MTAFKLNYRPSPNTAILGARVSTEDFRGAQFSPQQKLSKSERERQILYEITYM